MKVLKKIGVVVLLAAFASLVIYMMSNHEWKFLVEFTPFWQAISFFVVTATIGTIYALADTLRLETDRADFFKKRADGVYERLLTFFLTYGLTNPAKCDGYAREWNIDHIPLMWERVLESELATLRRLRADTRTVIGHLANLTVKFWNTKGEIVFKPDQLKHRRRTAGLYVCILARDLGWSEGAVCEELKAGSNPGLLEDILAAGVKRGFLPSNDPFYVKLVLAEAADHVRRMDDSPPPNDGPATPSTPPAAE